MPLALTTVLLGVFIVAGTIAATVLGVALARRFIPREPLSQNQEGIGVMFEMIGVLYAILLAFMVVVVWQQFDTAHQRVDDEVTTISNLMRDANGFEPATRSAIQQRLISYTDSVIHDEWKTMAHGESSDVTSAKYRQIWKAYYGHTPQTANQRAYYNESISRLNDLGSARRLRLLASESSIPEILWILLVAGAVITLGFVFLFDMPGRVMQPIVAGSLAGLTAFILFLILALNHPFAGQVKVRPTSFHEIVDGYANGSYRFTGAS